MKLHAINTGYFKLDGGAMFGVVPKSIWEKTNPPDSRNMCTWAMRSLLIEDGNRLVLIDCGIGNKQSDKFFSHYDLHGTDTLNSGLACLGFHRDDITDVILTHLHFDHCGGAIERRGDLLMPAFARATFHSNARHWEWAKRPNAREMASFLSENILPIEESGQLKHISRTGDYTSNALPGIDILFADGHTDSQMVPHLRVGSRTVVFMADLLPSTGHIPTAYVMGYDTRPLMTLTEKEKFMKRAADEHFILFFQHDPVNECCTVMHTEKGVRLERAFSLAEG